MNDKTNKLNRLFIDEHEPPFMRLYRAIFQQAVIDFDKCCFYYKHKIPSYNNLNEKLNTNREYKILTKYFESVIDSDIFDFDVKTVVQMIKNKHGL